MPRFDRPVRVVAVALAACAAGAGLAACGGVTASLTTCQEVHRSIATYDASLHAPNRARRSVEQQRAARELAAALIPAAAANGDVRFQALMTTIGELESPGVPEGFLTTSLQEQCARDTGATGPA